MSQIVIINADHDLFRFKNHDPPLDFGEHQFSSIEAARSYIGLVQDGHVDLARRLLNNRILVDEPGKIPLWVASQGISISTEWTFRTQLIFADVIFFQSIYQMSIINKAFFNIKKSATVPLADLQFVLCTAKREKLWSCGLRESEVLFGKLHTGHNCYGEVLGMVMKKIAKNDLTPFIGWPRDYFNWRLTTVPPYTQTVLLLSDSQARHVKEIVGGQHVTLSGGRYEDVAHIIKNRKLNLRDFHTVVINCGINDAQKHDRRRCESWMKLEALLRECLKDDEVPNIILSGAIPNSVAPDVNKYTSWITQRLTDTSIKPINWSEQYPLSRFDETMYAGDGLHLNEKGTRRLINTWKEISPALRFVQFILQETPSTIRRNKNGTFD